MLNGCVLLGVVRSPLHSLGGRHRENGKAFPLGWRLRGVCKSSLKATSVEYFQCRLKMFMIAFPPQMFIA